jgi:transposase
VETQRVWWKIVQKVLKHVGSTQKPIEVDGLKKTAHYIMYGLKNQTTTWLFPFDAWWIKLEIDKSDPLYVNLRNIKEEQRIIKWIPDIYGRLYEELWFHTVIKNPSRNVAATKCLKQITLARIATPKSKRASVEILDRDYGIGLNLDSVYNMMEKITDKEIEKIQELSYTYTKSLFWEKINVLFLDGTTLYFESQDEDSLRKKWFSKDGKFHETQVVLILLVTEHGLPIGYKLYMGNQYEGHTLQHMIEMVEQKYTIWSIFLAADSWFLSEENIKYLEKKWHKYALGARPKSCTKALKKQILDSTTFLIWTTDEEWNVTMKYKEVSYKWKRLIVTYKSARAAKEKKDREKQIKKLLAMEGEDLAKIISPFGYKKYIKKTDAKLEINQDKVDEDAKRDGIHAIVTNDTISDCKTILVHYAWLRQIEESFRINKHDLMVRPIFHRTEQKIKAHIAIAYMAFTLVRHLEYRMYLAGSNLSPERIRAELLRVQASILLDTSTNKKYLLPSNISGIWQSIYKAMNCQRSQSVVEVKM